MTLQEWLKISVPISVVYAGLSLGLLIWRTTTSHRKSSYAPAVGSATRGIVYAFTKGMMPGEKESVRQHLPTFVGGILYHLGIFVSGVLLSAQLLELQLSYLVRWPIGISIGVGFFSGVALLIKRLSLRKMRMISTPDDYVANALVDLFLLLALGVTFSTALLSAFYAVSFLLLVYIPSGKIRHCALFFFTRFHFGRLFGRRGVLPHPAGEKR